MHKIRALLAIAALALAACSPAHAADMRPAPVYTKAPAASTFSWSGLYIGGFVDYGANFGNAVTSGGPISIDLQQTPHGFGGGIDLEALYQPGGSSWVLGLRAEISGIDLSSTGTFAMPGASLSLSNATNYLGSFNAELGYALDPQLLAYVTGGLGFGGAKPNLSAAAGCLASPTTSCSQAASDTSVGFDIGAGLRYAFNSKVSIFIEGQYYGLGSKSLSIGTPPNGLITSNVQYNTVIQKLGITYNFGG